jgi:hypothetical protein
MVFRSLLFALGCLFGMYLPLTGYAAQPVCKGLLPQMRQNHIPDLALAAFENGKVHGARRFDTRCDEFCESSGVGASVTRLGLLILVRSAFTRSGHRRRH